MEYLTYFNILLITSCVLIGILIGIKIFTYKKGNIFTLEQLQIIKEIGSYANIVVNELKGQFGDDEVTQKEKAVEMICMEYPKIDRQIVILVVTAIFQGVDNILNSENQTS